ncbi:MAG: cytochrome C peroxidase [Polyangiaceae bacterium]
MVRSTRSVRWVLGMALFGSATACGATAPRGSAPVPSVAGGASEGCRPAKAHPTFTVLDVAGVGSSVALARVDGRTLAYVADEDDAALHVVDVDANLQVADVALRGKPSNVIALPDGSLVVALRDKGGVQVLEVAAANEAPSSRCSVETGTEPVALAVTPDRKSLLVTHGWGHSLDTFETGTFAKRRHVELPREPRAVLVTDDGTSAYVAHSVGAKMSVVDLRDANSKAKEIAFGAQRIPSRDESEEDSTPLERQFSDGILDDGRHVACQSFALAKSVMPTGRIYAPQVLVDPGDLENRPSGYGDDDSTEVPIVAVVEAATSKLSKKSVHGVSEITNSARDGSPMRRECLLPRAAAFDPSTQSLLVSCFGLDQVIAYDGAAPVPQRMEKARWNVGSGPTGIAVDAEKGRAVVWSQFDRSLHVFSTKLQGSPSRNTPVLPNDVKTLALVATSATPVSTEVALGRHLFFGAGDPRISNDGRACASCHPDGRDDAITWSTPNGPRRTPMLAGRIEGSAPYSWSGDGTDVKTHLNHTFERLRGDGLKGVELKALVAYVSTMAPPPKAKEDTAAVARGAAIFASAETQCASCHTPGAFTDGRSHDVGSQAKSDKTATFDTPSLRFVGARAPYFHDGRFTSLRELLVQSDGKMGHTRHLSTDDLAALESYLRSL